MSDTKKTQVQKIYLKDYTPPVYEVNDLKLNIQVFDEYTKVHSTLVLTKVHEGDLVLLGRKLELDRIVLNGKTLEASDYRLDEESLTILDDFALGERVAFEIDTTTYPQNNTDLEGLYRAGTGDDTMFVTQCEPEGFRKITFFPDRPDVLTTYTTRIEADKKFPVLLANGNLVEQGDLGDDRHFAVWHDPIKKPSYLFACVIAKLAVLQDSYTTSEGRQVLLEFYATPQDIDKCHVAMQALKDSMKWDEQHYGRAYDLDRYMVVATSQFNMGAMENKGLNIFNTACVLSSPDTTTDSASFRVKAVIAHEYFHNWTGNRVTCRDWFQLCLKEGLTVFREQSFSKDLRSPAVQRIDDVGVLRAAQFTEDAGALAHPVRPDSFVEINNFYTTTVYEKGAEIVSMMANLLGADKYRKAMDIYFERHDGQAVTVEDFVAALATQDARIDGFMQWYKQPGTPVLSGRFEHSEAGVVIHLAQSIREVAGFDAPKPLPIPVSVAVFDQATGELLKEEMLVLTTASQSFVLKMDLTDKTPLVSVLRGFSAPVILEFEYSDDELAKLVQFETDGFNRWQALQILIGRYLAGADNDAMIVEALKAATDELIDIDPMLAARLYDVPKEQELAAAIDQDYHPKVIKERRDRLKKAIAVGLKDRLLAWYERMPLVDYVDTPKAVGVRALRNVVLLMLAATDKQEASRFAKHQYDHAKCMSERYGALMAMVHFELDGKDKYLSDFYERFAKDDLVIDTWFALQAASDDTDIDGIQVLMSRADYDWGTPNRVRSVLSAVSNRPVMLWSEAGLQLYLSALERLDKSNPPLAARLLGALGRWYTLNQSQKAFAHQSLSAFQDKATSKNVLEVAQQILSAGQK